MKSLEKNKSAAIALIVFLAAIMVYNYVWKGSQGAVTSGASAENTGNDVVALDKELQAVTLDQSLFSDTSYRSLEDWSPSLPGETSGRTNPFAPIEQ